MATGWGEEIPTKAKASKVSSLILRSRMITGTAVGSFWNRQNKRVSLNLISTPSTRNCPHCQALMCKDKVKEIPFGRCFLLIIMHMYIDWERILGNCPIITVDWSDVNRIYKDYLMTFFMKLTQNRSRRNQHVGMTLCRHNNQNN